VRKRTAAADSPAGRRLTVSVRGDAEGEAALAKAYTALRRELDREPSGAELAEKTGVSKATANRWKQNRESRGTE
jgi:DNA-directed RNA polymerase specialized sigma subunit